MKLTRDMKAHLIAVYSVGVLFLFLDQILKWLANNHPNFFYYIFSPWLGWEFYKNKGIAFGIPVPQSLIIFLTPILLIFLIYFSSTKRGQLKLKHHIGMSLLASGAISNFIDRVLFEYTIDYLRIFTSVINLADILIVIGILVTFGEWDSITEKFKPSKKET